jgi:hypothetical protein
MPKKVPIWTGDLGTSFEVADVPQWYSGAALPVAVASRVFLWRGAIDPRKSPGDMVREDPIGFAALYTPFQFIGLRGMPKPAGIIQACLKATTEALKGFELKGATPAIAWGGMGNSDTPLSINWGRYLVSDAIPLAHRPNPYQGDLWPDRDVTIAPTLWSPGGWRNDKGQLVEVNQAMALLRAAAIQAGRLVPPASANLKAIAAGNPQRIGQCPYGEASLGGLYPHGVDAQTQEPLIFLGRNWQPINQATLKATEKDDIKKAKQLEKVKAANKAF